MTDASFTPPAPPHNPMAMRAKWLAVAALLALVVLCVAWELWLAPIRADGKGSWLALKALPLCVPLAGLLKNRMYTYRWVSLLVWLYVLEGLMRATTEHGTAQWLAVAELALCLLLFTACVLHIRSRLRSKRGAESATPTREERA